MSEKTIAEGIQDALQAMTEFATADVVINDWGILDQDTSSAPYVIIETADNFDSRQDAQTPVTTWEIQATLVEDMRSSDYKTALTNLRTRRQAIIDKINSDDIRSAGGLKGTTIDRVYSGSPIERVYDVYGADANESEPVFLAQQILLTVEEF